MSRRNGRTDLVGELGEGLVKNTFHAIMEWTARKDSPDDGVDLNVEIPAHGEYPTERFLVQVKTARTIKPLKNGNWSTTIKAAAARKYRQSRLAVFLFVVDLKTKGIRWFDLSNALRQKPDSRTFQLPVTQQFDEESADAFRKAVSDAIEAQNDCHYPPEKALDYRVKQLETKDPRFAVRGEIVAGKTQYTLTAKPGFGPRFKVVPLTKNDAKRLMDAQEFGSTAEVKLKSFQIDGSLPLTHEETRGSFMRVKPFSRNLRLAITSQLGSDGVEKSHIELNVTMARGSRGFELRSVEPECPFQFVLQLDAAEGSADYTIEIHYERWNGRPFAHLPLLEQILMIARCYCERGRLIFEIINYGERQEIFAARLDANRSSRFRQTVGYLKLLRKVSRLCREMGSTAVFNDADRLDVPQIQSIELAHKLLDKQSIPWNGGSYTINPNPDERAAVLNGSFRPPLVARMPLQLHFGKTRIGDMPVKVTINNFSTTENTDGTLTIHSKLASELSLDADAPVPES